MRYKSFLFLFLFGFLTACNFPASSTSTTPSSLKPITSTPASTTSVELTAPVPSVPVLPSASTEIPISPTVKPTSTPVPDENGIFPPPSLTPNPAMPAFIGRVIYISCDANFAICNLNTMNADGSNRKIILKGGNDFVYPAWSPDGKQIAFEIKDQINVINPDGSGKQRLTNAKYAAISPEWSADNSQIVYYQLMDLTMVNNLDL